MSESNHITSGRITKRQKRPILRPGIPSPYSGDSQQKVIYVSAKTPFISAVKRAERLLHLSDKRLVQSATQLSKKNRRMGADDEIVGIAREVERQKQKKKKGAEIREEVVLKGTGKAIGKVMELGLWFQQRYQEYKLRLETGSIGAIEDVEYEESVKDAEGSAENVPDAMEQDQKQNVVAKPLSKIVKREEREMENGKKEVSETRIRQLSVLEVYVSLR